MRRSHPGPSLDDAVALLDARARRAWAAFARAHRWTLVGRLSWAWPVRQETAERQLDQWAREMRARHPGVVVFVAVHTDASRLHAHCLLFIPAGGRPGPLRNRGAWPVALTKKHLVAWPYGDVWLERYRPEQNAHGGMAAYMAAKEQGTMICYGTPVPDAGTTTRTP